MKKRFLSLLLALCLVAGSMAAFAENVLPEGIDIPEVNDLEIADGSDWITLTDPVVDPGIQIPIGQGAAQPADDNPEASATPSVLSITIENPLVDEYSMYYPLTQVMQNEATKFTVTTNRSARYLFLVDERDNKLKTWAAAKYAKATSDSAGNKRFKWSVAYTFKTADTVTFGFAGAAKKAGKPQGKRTEVVEVVEVPVIKSVKCTPTKPDIGQDIQFTLKCNEQSNYLRLIDKDGNPIGTYGVTSTDEDDGTRVVKGTFSLSTGGAQKITFRCGYTKDRGFARKAVTIKVKDSAIYSASFQKSTVKAGDAIGAKIVTGTDVKVLGLFNDKEQLLESWTSAAYSKVKNGQQVWNVKFTFQRLGKRKLSFRARTSALKPYTGDDADQFGPAKGVGITVKGKSVVDVTFVYAGMAKMNDSNWFDYLFYWEWKDGHAVPRNDWYLASVDMLMLTICAPENAKYIHIYNEMGEQVVRLRLNDKTLYYEEYESVRNWYVPVILMKGWSSWGYTFTVKASVDGKKVGAGQTFTISGIEPEPLIPGETIDMYVSAINYPEESPTAVSLTAPTTGTYTITFGQPEETYQPTDVLHYYLYRAGSNAILREEIAKKDINKQNFIQIKAHAGDTYVLRLDYRDCSGSSVKISCSQAE